MRAYLDTQVAVWLGRGQEKKLSRNARTAVRKHELIVSPAVVLELELLYEIGRITVGSQGIVRKLITELDATVSTVTFADVAGAAISEGWTRDPFDRLIVANARFDGIAPLITADEHIQSHYVRAVW